MVASPILEPTQEIPGSNMLGKLQNGMGVKLRKVEEDLISTEEVIHTFVQNKDYKGALLALNQYWSLLGRKEMLLEMWETLFGFARQKSRVEAHAKALTMYRTVMKDTEIIYKEKS
ncbi:hypothetical protein D3C87_280310 [compost metagenome]